MSSAMPDWPRRHRISVDHYYRMAEAGLFEQGERVELINGDIIDMPPMGSRHAATLEHLAFMLTAAAGHRAIVRQQLPLRLADDSEPEPDIAVVRPRNDRYRSAHPTAPDVLLLVEISDATLSHDREVKVPLYARCGVPEVWLVDLQSARIHFYRTPVDGRYTDVTVAAEPGVTSLDSLPGVAIDMTPLFGD
jgi:Uma2 family endonuclease